MSFLALLGEDILLLLLKTRRLGKLSEESELWMAGLAAGQRQGKPRPWRWYPFVSDGFYLPVFTSGLQKKRGGHAQIRRSPRNSVFSLDQTTTALAGRACCFALTKVCIDHCISASSLAFSTSSSSLTMTSPPPLTSE